MRCWLKTPGQSVDWRQHEIADDIPPSYPRVRRIPCAAAWWRTSPMPAPSRSAAHTQRRHEPHRASQQVQPHIRETARQLLNTRNPLTTIRRSSPRSSAPHCPANVGATPPLRGHAWPNTTASAARMRTASKLFARFMPAPPRSPHRVRTRCDASGSRRARWRGHRLDWSGTAHRVSTGARDGRAGCHRTRPR